jgi:hypothetical protein
MKRKRGVVVEHLKPQESKAVPEIEAAPSSRCEVRGLRGMFVRSPKEWESRCEGWRGKRPS